VAIARCVSIPAGVDGATIEGDLALPEGARGLVIFAHGSGSSRFSPRNRHVATTLQERGLGTLLVDLLTEDEETIDLRTAKLRFDVGLLAARLLNASQWARSEPATRDLAISYFGASTGAAGALVAAASEPDGITAVVSRGGRPDLAGDDLRRVRARTLLIVGGADATVLALNRHAETALTCEHELVVIPKATHLFEEPGALDEVARHAGDWITGTTATSRWPGSAGSAGRPRSNR